MDETKNQGQPMKVGKTTCACGEGCVCGCGYGYRPGYHILRWVLGICILFFIFALGVKVGEFLTELRSYRGYGGGYGAGMMMNRGGYYNPGGPMIPATGTSTVQSQ